VKGTGLGRRRAVAAVALLIVVALSGFAIGWRTGSKPEGRVSAPAPSTPGRQDAPSDDDSSQEAMQAALAALLQLTSRAFVTDPAARARIVSEVATADDASQARSSGSSDQRKEAADPMSAALASATVSLWRLVPVGVRTMACSTADCTVQVWAVQITASTGEPASPARATWATTTLPMTWSEADGWRLRLSRMTTASGPTPALQPSAMTSSDLDVVAAGRQFRPLEPQIDAASAVQ
jgi:hypothetical protein